AACGMVVAARGAPSAGTFAATMVGLALACGGASALNHVLDRDLDVHMTRTDRRPVAANRVPVSRALEFGIDLQALSVVLLTWAYGMAALGLGGGFLWLALRLRAATTPRAAKVLFHYSLLYLALVFVAMALDAAVA